jgi:curli biogenesis system outer membrane secretion channel CsgG/tetratricopeptide (TPR) repeat protein
VATGQLKREESVTLGNDVALSAAAIREKVLAALQPDSQAANRVTVGIAAFTNRSNTDRSDKFGFDLQKSLRDRLKDQAWGVVLERQYPTDLLAEVDLSRAGLVAKNGVEKLPPADLVISGKMEDIDKEYQPGKPWTVKLDLTLRLRGHSSHVREACRSDAVETAADHVLAKLDELRRKPMFNITVNEKEMWRRQARYLMPRAIETWRSDVLTPNFLPTTLDNRREVIRAWENVLLLDDHDVVAMNYLGVFLISCNQMLARGGYPQLKTEAVMQCIAGSQLVERALRMKPTRERAASYIFCIKPLVYAAPTRAKEMAQYVSDHPEQFKGIPAFSWVKVAQTKPLRGKGEPDFAELDRALANGEKDPDALVISFPPQLTRNGSPEAYSKILAKYEHSPDPVVQFVTHRALGVMLCWQQGDPAALGHFDAAVAALEAAYKRCGDAHRINLDGIYQLRVDACQRLGLPEEAKKSGLAGVKHFMEIGRFGEFNTPVGWLYRYCVTEVLGPGEEKQALAICDAYVGFAKHHWERFDDWPRISAKREELLAKLASKPVPDMGALERGPGTDLHKDIALRSIRLAATDEKVWFVPTRGGIGSAMLWRHDSDVAAHVADVRYGATCVAVVKDAVFFGTINGLYKLDLQGNLLKHYGHGDPSFPGYGILDMCAGGGKIYFAFQGAPLKGVAVFDPASEKITVLSPSTRAASYNREPILGMLHMWWDTVTPCLYVGSYSGYNRNPFRLFRAFGWSPPTNSWQMYEFDRAPGLVVSYDNETLLARMVGDTTEFHFLKAGQKLTAAVPVPSLMGDPAWDDHRIWAPTSSGLYEVDRSTGHVRWLAYEDGNPFLSLLRHGNRLYVATAHGLYCGEISSAGPLRPPAASVNCHVSGTPMQQVASVAGRAGVLVGEQPAAVPAPAALPGKQKPKLAVTVSATPANERNRENWEDLLMVELANQPFLQIVDRQALHAVLKEHAIDMSALNDTKKVLALGKFAGADYLLHVAAEEKTATMRVVEVATGQLKREEQVTLGNGLPLSAAAVREKVLVALRPDSRAANRLTVGIAALLNRSSTDRSDKLGIELQKALRNRLKDKPWAVVLERQYPTGLLEEVDLARNGLVRENAVDKLPPADMVILGTLEDVNRVYEPNKPWEVRLDLTLRLRGHSRHIGQTFRSDTIDRAAGDLASKIDEFHREQPPSSTAVPEKELWRRQALYLMPARCETWCQAIVPNFFFTGQAVRQETIRAWENVLLLNADDLEAMTYLGVCQIGFNRWSPRTDAKAAQCIAGSRLVERAMRSHPTDVLADTYIACLGPMKDVAPARAKEMVRYILENPSLFKHRSMYWVKAAQNLPAAAAGGDLAAMHAEWKRTIQNAPNDPESVLLAFSRAPGASTFPIEQAADFLNEYLDYPDPVVRFVAHRNVAEMLCKQKHDAAGLAHYDKAIGVLEKAYARSNPSYQWSLDNIYQLRIEACQLLGEPEEACKTALAGARHFQAIGRSNPTVLRLYGYCVTEVLGKGKEKDALAICEAYLAAVERDRMTRPYASPRVCAKHEELMARVAGKPVPDSRGLRSIPVIDQQSLHGTGGRVFREDRLPMLRMAATVRNIWLVFGGRTGGTPWMYDSDHDEVRPLRGILGTCYSVATTKNAAFFGSSNGLYKFDDEGKLLKHYHKEDNSLPGNILLDVREGGGTIYLSFGNGIAALDPATNKVSVLAPSSRKTRRGEEPAGNVERLQWDAVTPLLYTCWYPYWYFSFPELGREHSWSPRERKWRPCRDENLVHLVASQGDETVTVRFSGAQSEFRFLKGGQTVVAAVPLPLLMGEPAWDEHRIWVATASGLYEVDRATAQVRWLAYKDDNPFLSLLRHGNRLYVATTRGLYYGEISPTGLIRPPEGRVAATPGT